MKTISAVASDVKQVCKAHGRPRVTGKEQPLRILWVGWSKKPNPSITAANDTLFEKHRREEGVYLHIAYLKSLLYSLETRHWLNEFLMACAAELPKRRFWLQRLQSNRSFVMSCFPLLQKRKNSFPVPFFEPTTTCNLVSCGKHNTWRWIWCFQPLPGTLGRPCWRAPTFVVGAFRFWRRCQALWEWSCNWFITSHSAGHWLLHLLVKKRCHWTLVALPVA